MELKEILTEALEKILTAYIPLLEALAADDLTAAAFWLEQAAEVERSAPEALAEARRVLPVGLALELELRQVETQLATVQAALRQLEE